MEDVIDMKKRKIAKNIVLFLIGLTLLLYGITYLLLSILHGGVITWPLFGCLFIIVGIGTMEKVKKNIMVNTNPDQL